MGKTNDHYAGALLEDIKHKLELVLEVTAPLSSVPRRLTSLEGKVDNLIDESKTTRSAMKNFSGQVHDHEHRLTNLETA